MLSLSFENFKSTVRKHWKNADDIGYFTDDSTPTRQFYTWQHKNHGAMAYDSRDRDPWFVDNGRGSFGRGSTPEEADRVEGDKYDEGYRHICAR